LAWACITNTWKEVPTGFFPEKMSRAFFRIAPLGKVTFFARRRRHGAVAQRLRKISLFGSHLRCFQGK
jgi:hypothetical protein